MEQPIGLLAIIDEHGEVVGVNGVAFSDDEQKMRAHVAAIDVPRRDDVEFSLTGDNWLILLGRYVCKARTPECWRCAVADCCDYRPKTPAPTRRS